MADFNPATMNPASIILKDSLTTDSNFDYYIIFIILLLCFFLFAKHKKII